MSLETCTIEVCAAAQDVIGAANEAIAAAEALIETSEWLNSTAASSGSALQCVINGPVGAHCNLPLGGRLPTLAHALSLLNATSIGLTTVAVATASGGEVEVTLPVSVSNDHYLEVNLDGALLTNPTDYSVSGTTLAFSYPLSAGDKVCSRIFTLA